MSSLRPSNWLWGLIPVAFVALMFLVGVAPKIEQDLQQRVSSALEQAEFSWATAALKGRDVVLKGKAADAEERDTALAVVGEVWGIRNVKDRVALLETVSPYTWWARREGDLIRIKGYVPDGRDRRTILGIVKAMMPELQIDDRMKRAAGAPPRETWVGAISFALNQLAQLKQGTAALVDEEISLDGEALSVESFESIKTSIAEQLPAGLALKRDGVVAPPATPFAWQAQYEPGAVTMTGFVPSSDARGGVLDEARGLFESAPIVDRTVVASGAPEDWSQVVVTVLTQLSRLESGTVSISDTEVTFEGVAADEDTARDVAEKVRVGLPAVYKSSEDVDHKRARQPSSRGKRTGQNDGSETAPGNASRLSAEGDAASRL